MTASAPIVTVILPVFNGARTLASAIESIRQQTFRNWELLVLDDASTDDSVFIGSSFDDERVVVVPKSGEPGLAARLNQGIDLARGKFIARMDADDIAFPMRLARQLEYLETHTEVDLLGTRAIVFHDDGSVVGLLPFAQSHKEICARPWNNFPLAHPTWMGRSAWFRAHRYHIPEYRRAEDQELLLRSYTRSIFACLPEVLLAYRQGDYNLKRILTARIHLLRAHIYHFMRINGVNSMLKSFCMFAIKFFIDLIASLPMADMLYFMRMNASPDAATVQYFEKIYEAYRA